MAENAVTESVLAGLPTSVRDEIMRLPRENQEFFAREYKKKKKSVLIAYLLWILYGTHYVYLERTDTAFWFWLTGGGVLVWWLIDLTKVLGMVREYNRSMARVVLADARAEKYQPRF